MPVISIFHPTSQIHLFSKPDCASTSTENPMVAPVTLRPFELRTKLTGKRWLASTPAEALRYQASTNFGDRGLSGTFKEPQ